MTRTVLARLALAAHVAALLPSSAALADPAGTTLIQSRTDGLGTFGPAITNSSTQGSRAVSADGCRVVFTSGADGLHAGLDDDRYEQVYLRDRCAGTTHLVSRSSTGTAGDFVSIQPTISADGTRVAFLSLARNLASPTLGSFQVHVYVRDLASNSTQRVTTQPLDSTGNRLALDGTGRRVAFVTSRPLDAERDANTIADAYVQDLTSNTVSLASRADTAVGSAVGGVSDIGLSDDGAAVAFVTNAIDANGSADAYVRSGDTTTLASARPSDGAAFGAVEHADISGSGGVVAFSTTANDGADTNGKTDVYARASGATTWVSERPASFHAVDRPSLSRDGQRVAFVSRASLVAADTNTWDDVFVRPVGAGAPELVSRASGDDGALGDGRSGRNPDNRGFPSLDGDGSVAAFDTSCAHDHPGRRRRRRCAQGRRPGPRHRRDRAPLAARRDRSVHGGDRRRRVPAAGRRRAQRRRPLRGLRVGQRRAVGE